MFNALVAWRYSQWRAFMHRRLMFRSLGRINRFFPEVTE